MQDATPLTTPLISLDKFLKYVYIRDRGNMQVQVNIQDKLWQESLKLGIKEKDITMLAEDALKKHISRLKNYRELLLLEGKINWEGNIDEMRRSRI
jgi:hypothetical protein